MTATQTVETTRIETTAGAVDRWALLVVLAGAVGLDGAMPPAAGVEAHEIASMEVAGEPWDGLTARLVVEPTDGGLAATLTTTGGEPEDATEIENLHGRVLDEGGRWLDQWPVVWRWTSDRCAPQSWHCGWRLTATRHPVPAVPAVPVATWRRWLAGGVDWAVMVLSTAVTIWTLCGVALHLSGAHVHHRRGVAWIGALIGRIGTPLTAVVLLAAVVALSRFGLVACGVLDPAADAPRRGWVRAWHGAQDHGVTVLLAAAVIALGGGWLT